MRFGIPRVAIGFACVMRFPNVWRVRMLWLRPLPTPWGFHPGPCGLMARFRSISLSCIGMSDQAPSALIDGVPLTCIQPQEVPSIINALLADQPVERRGRVERNLRKAGPVIFTPYEQGQAIRKALALSPEAVICEMNQSRLRGRGGAGFPLALKWDFCRKASGEHHFVVCNADEGEPGTFKDRVLLTDLPGLLFEGMTIAGYAIGASQGMVYLRGEYAYLLESLEQELTQRRQAGLLGNRILGQEGFDFDIRIQLGAGAYICGEESALLESLEGKRGAPRDRPPFPVQRGYQNQPTAVNNVETFCCAARIMEQGAEWFSRFGTRDSTGTKLLSISGDCEQPGVYEVEYGVTVESVLEMIGASGAQAVQVGGPSGQCIAPKDYGRGLAFEDLSTGGSLIVFGPQRDLLEQMFCFLEFFQEESCGWCTPCRAGTRQLVLSMHKILTGTGSMHDFHELENLALTVKTMSRCGLGQTAGNPILSTIKNFPALYEERIQPQEYIPTLNLQEAIQAGCEATGRGVPPERAL